MSETLDLLKSLIERESVTPNDADCQTLLIERLKSVGFHVETLHYGKVKNFWAWHGEGHPILAFAGHTDVVPPGPESEWETPPFTPTEREGYLFGRGAADMKSGLAAMTIATLDYIKANPNHPGTIGFIVTSDEEGEAKDGTVKVIEHLQQKGITLDHCVVGEASSETALGDAIKIGRRGSLHGHLTIRGKQGHIAYPQLADNPIHKGLKALDVLAQTEWDQGNDFFSPTSFQIHTIKAGTGASNVIPGDCVVEFNFRYAPSSSAEILQTKTETILNEHGLTYDIKWNTSSKPFFSGDKQLAQWCKKAIQDVCKLTPELNTKGGTSDGRFIAPTGCEVVELGPINKTIHKANECINLSDLEKLKSIYQRLLEITLK